MKIEWALNRVGYSDLFPWPEFGDPSMDELLEELPKQVRAQKPTSSLVFKSLWRNSMDAWARTQNRSLFQALTLCESHGLSSVENVLQDLNLLRRRGFRVFKIKMSPDSQINLKVVAEIAAQLKNTEKLRLDFNGTFRREEFKKFISFLPEDILNRIDLIEDPWDPKESDQEGWKPSRLVTNKLASDFFHHPLWPHQVVKTARAFGPETRPQTHRVIQTHSMDHPLGQAFSLWEASRYEKFFPHRREVHGVARANIYASTDFDWAWNGSGPRPQPPKGLGIGFDELLTSLTWEKM